MISEVLISGVQYFAPKGVRRKARGGGIAYDGGRTSSQGEMGRLGEGGDSERADKGERKRGGEGERGREGERDRGSEGETEGARDGERERRREGVRE